MPVELQRGGLRLSGTPLWFDARRKAELSFVSHAHSDHIARHAHVIATPQTIRLMEHRLGPLESTQALEYRTPTTLDGLSLELFAAGHVLGSAQVRVTRADGHRVVYTGDFSLEPSLTATSTQTAACDTLVMESTFGNPKFKFPPKTEVYDQVALWARRHLELGIRPILFAYSLGKAQETIKQLTVRGLKLAAHPSIHDIATLYTELGMPIEARRYDDTFEEGEIGIFPPFGRGQSLKTLPHKATAVLTGWALEPWAARRYGADRAFAISDHADFRSLVEYAKACGPREVITMHGFAEELAAALRHEGLFARAITHALQLELPGLR
jgi:putative mRNA 3-end processing factor